MYNNYVAAFKKQYACVLELIVVDLSDIILCEVVITGLRPERDEALCNK